MNGGMVVPSSSPTSLPLVPSLLSPSLSSSPQLLAQSLVRSRLSSSPTLLPAHLAQLVTALSLCARVSVRASALFIEAVLEGLQYTTVTGLGVTRRALIAAVGSARAMQYVKEGLDWSGRDERGEKSRDTFLQVLDKWTNLGTYFIHHTFTLAELFAMSSFYLTLNTLQTGFTAAEESVRLLDSILGSNESSRALSSIITLVRSELTREDPRYSNGGGSFGLIEDGEADEAGEGEKKDGGGPSRSTVASLAALTKALTAFACLQTATHRRTLKTLKLRVVYDCTVVVDESSSTSSSSGTQGPLSSASTPPDMPFPTSPAAPPAPKWTDPGRYGGPANPPRLRPQASPLAPPSPSSSARSHQRAKSTSALSFTPLGNGDEAKGKERRSRQPSQNEAYDQPHLLTDVRGELEARATARGSPAGARSRSRRESVVLSPPSLSPGCEREGEEVVDEADLPSIRLDLEFPGLDLDFHGGGAAADLLDDTTEEEILRELEELCGGEDDEDGDGDEVMRRSSPELMRSGGGDGEGYVGDSEAFESLPPSPRPRSGSSDDDLHLSSTGSGISLELELALRSIEEQYRSFPPSPSSSTSTLPPVPRRPSPTTGQGRYSYEVSIEETTTTTETRTMKTIRMPGGFEGGLTSEGEDAGMAEGYSSSLSGSGREAEGEDEEWDDVTSPGAAGGSGYETAEEREARMPSAPNGAGEMARGRTASVAGLSRIETLERPEESKQKLTVVLSTMTKKFTQRKRTIRRVSPSPPASSSETTPVSHSPASKRRWPTSARRSSTSTSTSNSSSSTATAVPDSPPTAMSSFLPSVSATTSPLRKGKSVLKAAVSKAFRQRQKSEDEGFETARSRSRGVQGGGGGGGGETTGTSTPYLSPMEEKHERVFGLGLGMTSGEASAYATARGTPAPPTQATNTRAPSPVRRPSSISSRQPSASQPLYRPPPPLDSTPSSTASTASLHSPPLSSSHPSIRRAGSVQTLRSTVTTTCTTSAPPPSSRSIADEGGATGGIFPHRHLVENLQRFARYSSAAYGQSFLRILGIGKHEFKFPSTQNIHANNHAFAHHVGIHVEDILLSSFTDPQPAFASEKISPIVNYVAVDHSISAVVLSCRGSLGLSDILVDLTCSYEPIPIQDADPKGSYQVHSGMFCSATTLQRGTVHDVIKEALEQFPSYGLVVCGHSLGGGVAALLSILWSSPASAFERNRIAAEQDQHRRITHPPISTPFVTSFSSGLPPGRPISCYTYGVPCVASLDLVDYCRGLVHSTVHNYDIVPTLSLGTLRDFKNMAMGFYAEQGTSEEIVGRVIGLCQRRFMEKRAAKQAASKQPSPPPPPPPPSTGFSFSPFSLPPKPVPVPPTSYSASADYSSASSSSTLTDPSDEARLVPLTADEITAGRGGNKALEPSYQDPSLVSSDDLVSDDVELSNWLWSLKTTIRASSDNEKLYPPGTVYVVENYTVFIASESSASGKYTRREGRRVLLRAVDEVERRFSEPVFNKTMLSDHSPAGYEACCDLLATAVL